jgi:hypothetical protein
MNAPVADPCANCGAPLRGEPYCARCGQRRARPLEVGRLIAEGAGQLVSWENAWWTTLRELTLRPGAMVRRYVAGERQRFVNPILYMVTTATALLLAMHALGVDIGTLQGVDAAQRDSFNLILRSIGYLAVVGALPVAALMRLVLRERSVGELYVLLVYAYGQLVLLQAVLYALGSASDPRWFMASRLVSGLFFGWVFAGYFGWRPVRAVLAGVAAYATMLGTLMLCGNVLVTAKLIIGRLTG